MRNIKLIIAFDGTGFSGWQRQKNANSIQGEIERALGMLNNRPVDLHGSGRTDAGVHALAMVAHFNSTASYTPLIYQNKLNSILPGAIRITSVEEVSPDFHARHSARSKTYLYNIDRSPIHSPHTRLYSVHVPQELSFHAMDACMKLIIGTHDFASFETSGSRDKSLTTGRGSVRTLMKAQLKETGAFRYQFEFRGDGFLRHMVRNIVGTLLDVGKGRTSVEEFEEILAAQDRSQAGTTAPARGLFLKCVHY